MLRGPRKEQEIASDIVKSSAVAISTDNHGYAQAPPYSPEHNYPEYAFGKGALCSGASPAYGAVREAMRLLGFDSAHWGTPRWNPLRSVVRPGETVVLKPNFVRDFRETRPGHGDCLITHGSVVRAVLDYAYLALGGRGRIVIADAPHNDANFGKIRRIAGLDGIQRFYRRHAGFEVEIYDLRPECAQKIDGVIVGHQALQGDPAGYAEVNLGMQSMFAEVNHLCHLLYGSEYETDELRSHQHDNVHEYLISKTILDADCVISIPKLKTHKKTGITANLKNLVGINGNKNWLPHHRQGTPADGGDQFADNGLKRRIERKVVESFKRAFPRLGSLRPLVAQPVKAIGKRVFGDTNIDTIRSGNWYGNDTTWRMVLDLNCILLYAEASGNLRDRPVRRFLSVVDAITAGEGNGPLDATPKPTGMVLAGRNAVAVDLVAARLMGFDFRRLPKLYRAFDQRRYPLVRFKCEDIICRSNTPGFDWPLTRFDGACLAFEPHFGWKGHVELDTSQLDHNRKHLCAE